MPTELVTVQSKCRELLGSQELVISSQAHLRRFNDYPEREYGQAPGSAAHLTEVKI
jgi:hypothetical protein